MRWTGPLLIVLALATLGCVRGDWTTETLTLVDVTGAWEGSFRFDSRREAQVRWILRQSGAKVRGEVQGPDGHSIASIEGFVNGELLNWTLTGPFVKFAGGSDPSNTYRGEATVNNDELSGRALGPFCPCTVVLRRVNTDDAIREKQAK